MKILLSGVVAGFLAALVTSLWGPGAGGGFLAGLVSGAFAYWCGETS